jgi:hypothetical protein
MGLMIAHFPLQTAAAMESVEEMIYKSYGTVHVAPWAWRRGSGEGDRLCRPPTVDREIPVQDSRVSGTEEIITEAFSQEQKWFGTSRALYGIRYWRETNILAERPHVLPSTGRL